MRGRVGAKRAGTVAEWAPAGAKTANEVAEWEGGSRDGTCGCREDTSGCDSESNDPSASPDAQNLSAQQQEPPYYASSPLSFSTNQENPNLPEVSIEDADQASMANFIINPQPYLIAGLNVDHGWNRPYCARVAQGGEPTRKHEDYAIVTVNPMPLRIICVRRSTQSASSWNTHRGYV